MNVTELFREHDAGLVASRFSRFDPSAEGLQELREGGRLLGALIVRRARARSAWRDFTGAERAEIAPGHLIVRRFAAAPGGEAAMVEELAELEPQLLEGWVESESDRAILDALEAAWLGTKVSAFGELRGLYRLGGAGIDYGLDGYGLARLALPWDRDALAAELEAAAPFFAPHYSHYNKRRSWSACSLRGYSHSPAMIEKPAEMAKGWKAEHAELLEAPLRDTPLMRRFPSVQAIVAELGACHRVRLMALEPGGGELSRHADITDPDAGTGDGQLLRLHLPISTNRSVRFCSWRPSGQRRRAHMAAGEAWWLYTRLPHTARNDGPSRRVHLVIVAESSPALRARLSEP